MIGQRAFRWAAATSFGVAILVVGCGGGGGGKQEVVVASVVVPNGQAVQVDQLKFLSVQAYDAGGGTISLSNADFTWSVQNGGTFLSFQPDGRARGLATGTATVVATAKGVTSAPASVSVTAANGCSSGSYTPNYFDDINTPDIPNVSGSFRHWTHAPLKIYFHVDSHWTQTLQDIFKQGVTQWNASTSNGISVEYTANAAEADITVQFLPSSSLPGNAIGVTYSTFDPTTREMSGASVQIADDLGPASVTLSTCSHEYGHALGIGGHSPNDTDLMYYAENGTSAPNARDLNTMKTNYCNFFPWSRSRAPSGALVTERIICKH